MGILSQRPARESGLLRLCDKVRLIHPTIAIWPDGIKERTPSAQTFCSRRVLELLPRQSGGSRSAEARHRFEQRRPAIESRGCHQQHFFTAMFANFGSDEYTVADFDDARTHE